MLYKDQRQRRQEPLPCLFLRMRSRKKRLRGTEFMKISHKLLVLCSIPMTAFLVVSALYALSWLEKKNDVAAVRSNITLFSGISGLVNEIQKERGLSNVFLTTGNSGPMTTQRGNTDKALARLAELRGPLELRAPDGGQ